MAKSRHEASSNEPFQTRHKATSTTGVEIFRVLLWILVVEDEDFLVLQTKR